MARAYGNHILDFLPRQGLPVRRHHSGLRHCAATQGDEVLQVFIALAIQSSSVVHQRRHGIQIRAIGRPRRCGIRMAPDALRVENPLPLGLPIVQRNDALWVVPVRFRDHRLCARDPRAPEYPLFGTKPQTSPPGIDTAADVSAGSLCLPARRFVEARANDRPRRGLQLS